MACNCPPGYTLLPDGITCEKVVYEIPLPLSQILKVSEQIAEPVGPCGLIVYEDITSNQNGGTKQWPIISSVQNAPYFSPPFSWNSLSVIPDVGPNWTSIFPPKLTAYGNVHDPVLEALPSPYPPTNWPTLPCQIFSPLRESVVTSNVLNYGTGNLVNITNFTNSGVWYSWRLQKCVWTTPDQEYVSLGFTFCINVTEQKQYYIVASASNSFYIYLNDELAVECNSTDGNTLAFNFANAFPITLQPGLNTIYLQGYNFAGGGALAADVLDITLSQLLSAPNDAALDQYRIFSTKWKVPRLIYITGNGTTTATLTPLVVQPALQEYDLLKFLNTTIGIPTGTFIVGFPDIANGVMLLNQPIASGTYTIELYSAYDLRENNTQWSCPEGTTFCGTSGCSQILTEPCTPDDTFYELTDCSGSANVVTCTDLSNYLGMVIKLKSCPDICWKVGTTNVCDDPKKVDINDIIAEYPPIAVGTTCVYDIDNVVDTRVIPEDCIASVVIYINGIPYTFPYTNPQTLATQITSLLLGDAEYIVADKTIVITGTNIYENLVFVTKVECQNQEVPVTISVSPTCINVIDYDCASCLPQPQPEPIPEARKVRPGYFIKNPCLTTDYVEKVNCNFGNQVFDQMISVRYGINSCCEVDVNKWDIKKHIVDYALMTIPKEEEYTPRTCYCYNISAKDGAGVFKYLSCDGTWTTVSLNSLDQVRVCSQNTPQFVSGIYTPEGITSLGSECTTNDDCNIN